MYIMTIVHYPQYFLLDYTWTEDQLLLVKNLLFTSFLTRINTLVLKLKSKLLCGNDGNDGYLMQCTILKQKRNDARYITVITVKLS